MVFGLGSVVDGAVRILHVFDSSGRDNGQDDPGNDLQEKGGVVELRNTRKLANALVGLLPLPRIALLRGPHEPHPPHGIERSAKAKSGNKQKNRQECIMRNGPNAAKNCPDCEPSQDKDARCHSPHTRKYCIPVVANNRTAGCRFGAVDDPGTGDVQAEQAIADF